MSKNTSVNIKRELKDLIEARLSMQSVQRNISFGGFLIDNPVFNEIFSKEYAKDFAKLHQLKQRELAFILGGKFKWLQVKNVLHDLAGEERE